MTVPNRAAQITELLGQLAGLMAEAERPAVVEPQLAARPRVLLTVEEAAEQLGIGKTKTYALVKSGDLESVLIGRLRRIHVNAIAKFADRLVADQHRARRVKESTCHARRRPAITTADRASTIATPIIPGTATSRWA